MLGLKRGTVELFEHQKEWEDNAVQTIAKLKDGIGNNEELYYWSIWSFQ